MGLARHSIRPALREIRGLLGIYVMLASFRCLLAFLPESNETMSSASFNLGDGRTLHVERKTYEIWLCMDSLECTYGQPYYWLVEDGIRTDLTGEEARAMLEPWLPGGTPAPPTES